MGSDYAPTSSDVDSQAEEAAHVAAQARRFVEDLIAFEGSRFLVPEAVFGSGSAKAGIMFVGEAPGAEEDRQGLPFVGAAGQLLTKIIEAMQLQRDEVYICNVLKCRPPGNRDPMPEEISTWEDVKRLRREFDGMEL